MSGLLVCNVSEENVSEEAAHIEEHSGRVGQPLFITNEIELGHERVFVFTVVVGPALPALRHWPRLVGSVGPDLAVVQVHLGEVDVVLSAPFVQLKIDVAQVSVESDIVKEAFYLFPFCLILPKISLMKGAI